MNRTKLALKGIASGFGMKILGLLTGFVSRTLFIYYLGTIYLGVNGLYSNILTVLSFANLGFGSAINFALYKPIAQNDTEKIIQLIDYYKIIYRIVALVITIVGLALVPAIPYLVKGAEILTQKQLIIYYLIFLFNTVVSYFVSYKTSYVAACQKQYIVNIVETITQLVTFVVQVIVLVVFKNFTAYLLANSITLLLSRVALALFLNKKFPVVHAKPKEKLPKEDKKGIFSNVKGLVVHQFAGVAVHATDNIIISSMISVVVVGYISNYNLIITTITGFLDVVFSSFSSTFGNVYATQTKQEFYNYFKIYNYINFWLFGFCCTAFFVLVPPFITLWIGAENLIDVLPFALIVISEYLLGQSKAFNNVRNAVGNFNKDKWWALAQAIVNLVVSIIGAHYLGLVGIYIGTIASRFIWIIFRPMSTFKLMFGKSSMTYYFRLAFYFIVSLLSCVITYYATKYVLSIQHWGWFLLGCVIVLFVSNAVIALATCWTKDFRQTASFVWKKIKNKEK